MTRRCTALTLPCLLASTALADPLLCDGGLVSVTGADPGLAADLCTYAEAALPELATCNLSLERPVEIRVSDSLPDDCVGLYHCGEDWIEVLAPDTLEQAREGDSIFAPLPTQDYLQSIVVHELTHAALDDMPCPFGGCVATQEYVAYAMQIRSLQPEMRDAVLGGNNPDTPINRNAISPMVLYMAPDVFAVKAYLHFTQRDDPCGYIGLIADGAILLDVERP